MQFTYQQGMDFSTLEELPGQQPLPSQFPWSYDFQTFGFFNTFMDGKCMLGAGGRKFRPTPSSAGVGPGRRLMKFDLITNAKPGMPGLPPSDNNPFAHSPRARSRNLIMSDEAAYAALTPSSSGDYSNASPAPSPLPVVDSPAADSAWRPSNGRRGKLHPHSASLSLWHARRQQAAHHGCSGQPDALGCTYSNWQPAVPVAIARTDAMTTPPTSQ